MSNPFFAGTDTPDSSWIAPLRAGDVSTKITLMRCLMVAVVSAYETRYTVERCTVGDFETDREETLFFTANALATTLSVSIQWLESNHPPDQTVPPDPMIAWVMEACQTLFTEFRELPWVSTKFEKGQLCLGIKAVDAPRDAEN